MTKGSVARPGSIGRNRLWPGIVSALVVMLPMLSGMAAEIRQPGRTDTPGDLGPDALAELLDSMPAGAFMRLNDRAYNLQTGPGDIYTRDHYDTGSSFDSDRALKEHVMGIVGGGDTTNDQGRMLYSGAAYDTRRKLVVQMGGGHSNGAMNHAVAFDVAAAAASRLRGGSGGKWLQYTDPAPLGPSLAAGGRRDPAWPEIRADVGSFRWPQRIRKGILGPDGNIAPYALHTYSAILYDHINDRLWVSGGSVGNHAGGGVNPNGTWWLDPRTRRWTLTRNAAFGGDGAAFLMAPEGANHLFYSTGLGQYVWKAMNIDTEASVTTTNGNGVTAGPGVGAAPMWIKDLTETGKYDIVRWRWDGRPFVVYPRQWPLPKVAQSNVHGPLGNGGSRSDDKTYFTFGPGVARKFSGASGYSYVEEEKLIFAFTSDSKGGFLIQTIDPFQGSPTGRKRWHVENWRNASYTGDVPTIGEFFETNHGFNNKVIDLGPEYKAWLIVCNPRYGDVILVKRSNRA